MTARTRGNLMYTRMYLGTTGITVVTFYAFERIMKRLCDGFSHD